jgi:ADP-ribose pyrophosphatase YjhB (NUDIX family)
VRKSKRAHGFRSVELKLARTRCIACFDKRRKSMQAGRAEHPNLSAMTLSRLRILLEPLIRRCLHFYWRFARGMTFGVRARVFDPEHRVCLVKHSYVDGWHLPGGGVEVGETVLDALRRELHEEGNIALDGQQPLLHGIFFNRHVSRRDHVAVYIVREFRQGAKPAPNREIVDCGFFDVASLPAGTTGGTRARIEEAVAGRPISLDWR